MMVVDYPASHSTDAEWYAVDRDGHVGFFETHEEGVVPDGAAAQTNQLWDQMLRVMSASEIDQYWYAEPTELARLGVFSYSHHWNGWIAQPYERNRCPQQPIHVDQLPPRLRRVVLMVRFDSVCFADAPYVQPLEHRPCQGYGHTFGEPYPSAFLSSDGQTVKPIAGFEEAYFKDYAEVMRHNPELAKRYRFEVRSDGSVLP